MSVFLIADDFPAILELVKNILNAYPGFEVVGEARDGQHAVALAEALKPDVIVLNVTMPMICRVLRSPDASGIAFLIAPS